MKKIYLETFGCQMNVLDSELVANQLRSLGYSFTAVADEAEIVLYNTCSVRQKSEQKVWSRLGRLRERKADDAALVIGVIGCMAERDGVGLMKRMPHVDLMCGPSELDQLPALLENVYKTGRQQHALAGNTSRRSKTLEEATAGHPTSLDAADGLELLDLSRSFSPMDADGTPRRQAYIRIVRGCDKFCTYCVVPYTRGAEVSRAPAAILEEARKLVDAGCLEITLLGQTVNHYVYEEPLSAPAIVATAGSTASPARARRTTFAELLRLLHDRLPELPRLRFLTSYPADFGDDILQVMRDCPRICRYLHIPAQSGSNRILKAMNRGYTAESYLELVERARRIVPGIQLAGDFIVGFPGESDDDYALTRDLVARVRYKNSFIFKYSPRPGTVAIRRFQDDVPEDVKRFRNNDLLRVQNQICNELNRELVGQTVEVLCDGASGWNQNSAGADSVIAGANTHDSNYSQPVKTSVELGATLRAGIESRARPVPPAHAAPRVDRTGNPYESLMPLHSQTGWVQLSGRTVHDQIVVFQGPVELAGKLLPVRVRQALGMTIFGEWAQASGAALLVATAAR